MMSAPPEECGRSNAVMTSVGGNVVYGEDDCSDLAPPLPPASPSWAPVGAFASPGMRTASVQPSVQHARSCHDGCASACGIHGHDHRIAWANPIPARDLKSFWGALGCSCRSEEHTSELQSLMRNSSAVFCLKKKKKH